MSTATPEGKVKDKVKKLLKKYGIYYCMPMGTVWGKAGVPDIIACVYGKFVGIETKAGKGKCTKLQAVEQQRICDSGGVTFVVNENSMEQLEEWLGDMTARFIAASKVVPMQKAEPQDWRK